MPAEPLEEREAHGNVPDRARSFLWRPLQHQYLIHISEPTLQDII
jgi:hypothetical protein